MRFVSSSERPSASIGLPAGSKIACESSGHQASMIAGETAIVVLTVVVVVAPVRVRRHPGSEPVAHVYDAWVGACGRRAQHRKDVRQRLLPAQVDRARFFHRVDDVGPVDEPFAELALQSAG